MQTHRPTDTEAWRAVQTRDRQYDGLFVYAVRTTRIYCRPSCPSRRPAREHVSFFEAPDAAERAGFRACLRCGPRASASPNDRVVARARKFLDEHTDRIVSLAELASHAGVSVGHLQKSFKRIIGISPKEYQNAHRLSHFKKRLRSGDSVSRATYDAGFGSSSRVYERSNELLGMTPAAYRRGGLGVHIQYTIADAPIGRVLVATTERGVCAVALGESDADVERALRLDFPKATVERRDDMHGDWVHAVLEQIRDPHHTQSGVPIDAHGTAFQWRVWKALQTIPSGERRTYREIADEIGQPTASRAVARACATNRVAVVIPCHRVVREDGAVSGYKWGEERKRRLLEDEET